MDSSFDLQSSLILPRIVAVSSLAQELGGSSNEDQPKHKCDKCGRAYVSRKALMRHVNRECGMEPKYQCPYCQHKSKQRTHIYRHVRTNHPGKEVCAKEIDYII